MVVAHSKVTITEARNDEYLRELFFEQNINLVRKAVNSLKNIYTLEEEEKMSLGSFGLVKAFNTYDTNSGYAFSTYAIRCMTNEILMAYRKVKDKNKRPLSLDAKIEAKDDELTLLDTIKDEEEDFSNEDYKLIKEVYNKFVEVYSIKEPRIIQAFNMYIFQEKTTTEIATSLGMTQSAGSRIATRAIKAIQEIAIEMEVIETFSRYAKRATKSKYTIARERDKGIKERSLYVILNYPELTSKEIAKIVNWSSVKVGRVREMNTKGKLTIKPDDSIKPVVEKYLANKKMFS